VLAQQPTDRDKVYSLHEPQVYCLAKGKEHKKYEFGSKASVVLTKTGGVIVGAVAHPENLYEGDALVPALEQTQAVAGRSPDKAIVDRGCRGRKQVKGTEVLAPGKAKAGQTRYQKAKNAVAVPAAGGDWAGDWALETTVSSGALLPQRFCGRPSQPAAGRDGVEPAQVAAANPPFWAANLSPPVCPSRTTLHFILSVKHLFRSDYLSIARNCFIAGERTFFLL
jgi:hypothetical protein